MGASLQCKQLLSGDKHPVRVAQGFSRPAGVMAVPARCCRGSLSLLTTLGQEASWTRSVLTQAPLTQEKHTNNIQSDTTTPCCPACPLQDIKAALGLPSSITLGQYNALAAFSANPTGPSRKVRRNAPLGDSTVIPVSHSAHWGRLPAACILQHASAHHLALGRQHDGAAELSGLSVAVVLKAASCGGKCRCTPRRWRW